MSLSEDITNLKTRAVETRDVHELGEILAQLAHGISHAEAEFPSLLRPVEEAIRHRLILNGPLTRDEVLFVTAVSSLLAQEEVLPSVRLDQTLDCMMTFRQELLTAGVLPFVLEAVAHSTSLTQDPRFQFLSAVDTYDQQHQIMKRGGPPDWSIPLEKLEEVWSSLDHGSPAKLRFFVANQTYLVARNAALEAEGDDKESLQRTRDHYATLANEMLGALEAQQAHEAIGYLAYNLSRQRLVEGNTEDAWSLYVQAAGARKAHFESMQQVGTPTDGYATQVVKVAFDADFLFPDYDLASFPLSEEEEKAIVDLYNITAGFSLRSPEQVAEVWKERYGYPQDDS